MEKPRVKKTTYRDGSYGFKFAWEKVDFETAGGAKDIKYVLLWNKGQQGALTDEVLVSTKETRYTKRSIRPGSTYSFAVRADNRCGAGIKSDLVYMNFNAKPAQITRVRTTSDSQSCGYQISW